MSHIDVIQHRIRMKAGTNPIATRQYRLPEKQRDEVYRQLSICGSIRGKVRFLRYLSQGIIEPSISPWNSPILAIPKKAQEGEERSYRLVIDFKKAEFPGI